jgi:GMP synthase (glutamine-hydrolysing)
MILIIDCGSQKTVFIEQCVDEFMDFQTVSFHSLTNEDLLNKKGVIISGAPLLITEINIAPYLEKVSWIKTLKIPILGICFGHQLIGLTFGAFGSRMKEDRDWQTIEVFEDCDLFKKLPTEIEMMEDHCESISIPEDFILVASSDSCVNEAMKHKQLPIYGVQFHPEVSGNHGRVLFDNFIQICENYISKSLDSI